MRWDFLLFFVLRAAGFPSGFGGEGSSVRLLDWRRFWRAAEIFTPGGGGVLAGASGARRGPGKAPEAVASRLYWVSPLSRFSELSMRFAVARNTGRESALPR